MRGYVNLRFYSENMLEAASALEAWALGWLDKHPDDDFQLGYAAARGGVPIVLVDWEPKETGDVEAEKEANA